MSKLRLQEMGSRYLFIVLYVFLENHLSRGDYLRPGAQNIRLKPHRAVDVNDERDSDPAARA